MDAFPYLSSNKNLPSILQKIKGAGSPPRFSNEFLKTSLGFSSSNDRAIISVLRELGFISNDGTPTARYNAFRSDMHGGTALADGLKEGWPAVFLADQKAHTKSSVELRELFKTISGKSESVAEKMAATFKALADQADWKTESILEPTSNEATSADRQPPEEPPKQRLKPVELEGGRLTLSHDIHVHLPPSSDVAVYRAIFRALREELID